MKKYNQQKKKIKTIMYFLQQRITIIKFQQKIKKNSKPNNKEDVKNVIQQGIEEELKDISVKGFLEEILGSKLWIYPITLLLSLLGGWFTFFKSRRQWKSHTFLDKCSFTLVSFHDELISRTLFEEKIEVTLFGNTAAEELVMDQAQKTDENQSVIYLPKEDHYFIINDFLNEISSKYSSNYFFGDISGWDDKCVLTEWYVFALTFEKHAHEKKKN